MTKEAIRFFWTSGRKCNFDGCDRADLQPSIVNGKNTLTRQVCGYLSWQGGFGLALM